MPSKGKRRFGSVSCKKWLSNRNLLYGTPVMVDIEVESRWEGRRLLRGELGGGALQFGLAIGSG